MNYKAHYERLIARARKRVLGGYVERHHVVPRCMGGGDETHNIVALTAEEHYVAHQLLVKINQKHTGLIHAAVFMAKKATGAKAYGWLRRRHALLMSIRFTGKPLSDRHRKLVSLAKTGKPHPRTQEWSAKIGAANRGRKHSAVALERMSLAQRGNKHNLGKKFTQAHRANLSASLMGHRGCKGIHKTIEHRAKIAAALRGRPLSEDRKAKISRAMHKYFGSRQTA